MWHVVVADGGRAASDRLHMTIACSHCGTRQSVAPLPARAVARCRSCARVLERSAGRSTAAALGCAFATLLLLIPANVLPLMRSHLQGSSRESHLYSAAEAMWIDDWPLLGILVGLFVVAFPILRTGLLTLVLASLQFGWKLPGRGRVFRYAEELRPWSMLDVALLAAAIAYTRTASSMEIDICPGGWCFIAAVFLALIAEGSIDAPATWRSIGSDAPDVDDPDPIACRSCELLVPRRLAPGPCPRCRRRLPADRRRMLVATTALTVAGFVLYLPGYLLPMSRTVRPGGLMEHTIVDGVSRLASEGYWYFAVIIFVASIAIPALKLLGLSWLVVRARRPRRRGRLLRTRIYRLIDEAGRWSHIDPFIVAAIAPLLAYTGIADTHLGPAALPFTLVVVTTMLASRAFDPRAMWVEDGSGAGSTIITTRPPGGGEHHRRSPDRREEQA